MKLGTWNVQDMSKKDHKIFYHFERFKIKIATLTETKRT